MYLQIIEQIKNKIASGEWPQGHKLPSIRELAVSINVSVITVKRAYQELENDSVIFTQHGKGSFVADGENMGLKLKRAELEAHLRAALDVARVMGMSTDEVSAYIDSLAKEGQQTSGGRHE